MFKYRDGAVPNLLAIGYVAGGHAAGIELLVTGHAPGRIVGFLLAVHTLAVSTYLLHECMHETLFADRRLHARLGAVLAWWNGARYGGYAALQRKHLHHHLDRTDPITFDFRDFLRTTSPALRRAIIALEGAHVPALEAGLRLRGFFVPWMAGVRPSNPDRARGSSGKPRARKNLDEYSCGIRRIFAGARRRRSAHGRREDYSDGLLEGRPEDRARVTIALLSRVLTGAALFWISPAAFALYGLAATLAIVLERFLDAFHHTFDLALLASYDEEFGAPGEKDRAYEHGNTFSNLVSTRWPALNLLFLNFPYHNAHHAKPGVPWHRLPGLDRRLYGSDARQVLPLRSLVAAFHRYRLPRLLGRGAMPGASPADERLLGAAGVSLLTL